MKLTAKLVLVLIISVTLVAVVSGYFAIEREKRMFNERVDAEAERIASTLEPAVIRLVQDVGPEAAAEMLSHMARGHNVQVRWVWFDVPREDRFSPEFDRQRLRGLTVHRLATFSNVDAAGRPVLHSYWPCALDSARRGGLEFSRSVADLEQAKSRAIANTVSSLAATLVIAIGCAALWGTVFVSRPLQRLIEKTRRVAKGDLEDPIHVNTRDELGTLATSLNDMCEQLGNSREQLEEEARAKVAALDQLRHADRLKTVGRLAAGVAHELGTPLSVIAGRAELLASGELPAEATASSANAIKHEADRMAAIIRQLLDFARRETPTHMVGDVCEVISRSVNLIAPIAAKQNVQLHWDCSEDLPTRFDESQLQQVLSNIIMNATQAMPNGGDVRIWVTQREGDTPSTDRKPSERFHAIHIEDNGIGITPKDQSHIFEPFFTTKDVGEGTGLGLSVAHNIVEDHGGWITVESKFGEGAEFTIYLPAAAREG